jgi:hypothetical protein
MPISPSSIKKATICGKCGCWIALNAVTNRGWGKCDYEFPKDLPKCLIVGYVNENDDKFCPAFREKEKVI